MAGKGSSSSASSGSGKAGATPAALQAPLDSAVEAPAVRLQDSPPRGRRMNLIEQLELKYGHTVFGLPTSSEEDSYGSEESMLDPDEDSGGDGGNGGGGGGGGGVSGGDDTGVAKSRKRKKPKRKKGLPGDDLDYDDDFIDDSELEKAYYAKVKWFLASRSLLLRGGSPLFFLVSPNPRSPSPAAQRTKPRSSSLVFRLFMLR